MNKEFDFLLFGATGDLAMRKIFPALYDAFLNNRLSENFRIIATGRSKLNLEEFKEKLEKNCKIHIKDVTKWNTFLNFIIYESVDISNLEDFKKLKAAHTQGRDLIVYFSISPEFFITCCKHLAALGMNADSRIVLEKPLGLNLAESKAINEAVAEYFKEEQIYRIDHYLGKQMVQQLLNLRANDESINAQLDGSKLSGIELCVYERLGVEQRGEFYDSCGAMRDMLQNHMLQMLALFAIDPHAADIRAAKAEFFNSLERFDEASLSKDVFKAQYVENEDSASYLNEPKVKADSRTETYVQINTTATSGRLAGVPISLKTGKRMPENRVYLKASFKAGGEIIFNIQPECYVETIEHIDGVQTSNKISFDGIEEMPPYERLILDVIAAKLDRFNEKTELEAAWSWLQPVIDDDGFKMHKYKAYTKDFE